MNPLRLFTLGANTNGTWGSTTFSGNHAYALFLNPNTGTVDFSLRGTGGTCLRTVIATPYLAGGCQPA